MRIGTILVALDGSAPSERALALAEDLMGTGAARLVLVTVLERLVLLAGEFTTLQDPSREMQDIARKRLEQKAGELTARGRRAETCVAIGEPCGSLLEMAERYEADVIVTGRSGKGPVARVVMGSVTTSLLHRTDKPILVVP